MDTPNDARLDEWTNDRLSTLGADPAWRPDARRGIERAHVVLAARAARRHRWAVAGVSATAATALVLVVPATRLVAQRCVAACVSQATRVGQLFENAPPQTVGVDPGLIGTLAPDFTLEDASGAPLTLSHLRGQVVLLNFWATWCTPCATEAPWFSEFQRQYGAQGLTVLGISQDDDGWTSVRPFLAEGLINYPVVIGTADVAAAFGHVRALPATFVIDRLGRIAAVQVGLVAKEQHEAAILSALNQSPSGDEITTRQ